jgi:hypothetical protein
MIIFYSKLFAQNGSYQPRLEGGFAAGGFNRKGGFEPELNRRRWQAFFLPRRPRALRGRRCRVFFSARRYRAFACTAEGPAFSRVFFSVSAAILSTFSAADRQRPAATAPQGGVEFESFPARLPVNRVFVKPGAMDNLSPHGDSNLNLKYRIELVAGRFNLLLKPEDLNLNNSIEISY